MQITPWREDELGRVLARQPGGLLSDGAGVCGTSGGVQLGGLNYYFGRPVEKPFLGDPLEDLNWNQFSQVRLLLYLVAAVSYLAVGLSLL